jgi:hypothetical protein
MSPDPGDTLVHHIVDEILLTNDADFEQLDYEIAATLRGLSYNKLMEILKSPSEISALKYSDPNGNEITISADVKNRLQAFVPFANACQNSFGVPSLDGKVDLLTKNRIHFDGYIEYEYNPKKPTVYDPKLARESSDKRTKVVVPLNNYTANVNAPPSYPISNRPVPSKSDQLVNTFEKGRRNLENYPVMKHDDEYDNWNRLLKAFAATDRCSEVLDPSYSPQPDETEVFYLKQRYMFTVLLKTCKTTKGDELVKKYEHSYDAQKIYRELSRYYTESQVADLRTDDLLKKIVSARMPRVLQKSRKEYLADLKEHIRQYNALVPFGSQLTDTFQLDVIKRFAASDPQINQSKLIIEGIQLATGQKMAAPKAMGVLEYNAISADAQDAASILELRDLRYKPNKGRRAYSSDLTGIGGAALSEDDYVQKHWVSYQASRALGPDLGYTTDYDYGRDTNDIMDDVREVYRSQSRNRNYARGDDDRKNTQQDGSDRCRLSNDTFKTLSQQDRTLFSAISNEGTTIISNYFKNLALQHPSKQTVASKVPGRNAHFSEIDENGDEEGEGNEDPGTRGAASRTVQTHLISTAFSSPFDTESLPRDGAFEANNATMDLEPTNPVRFLSQSIARDDKSETSSKPPDLVEREDSVSSADGDDSFFDGQGSFQLVMPKKKKKKKKKTKNNRRPSAPAAPHETPSAAADTRAANAFEIMKYNWDESASETDSRQASMAKRSYRVSKSERRSQATSLVDRGANGMIAGADVRLIARVDPRRTIDVTGLADHQITDLSIGSYGAVCETNQGPVITIFHEAAGYGRGKSILCPIQMEDFCVKVGDRPVALGGTQSITTLEGFVIPLDVINGLCYMKLRPFTDQEWRDLVHVEMTSGTEWDPT